MRILNGVNWILPAALLLSVACSSKSHNEWYQVPAGQSHSAMGITVDGASNSQMEQIESAGGKVRAVYGGVFEVHGLPIDEIKKIVPEASVTRNTFYPNQQVQRQQVIPDCATFEKLPDVGWITEPRNLINQDPTPAILKRNGQKIKVGLGGPDISKTKYKIGVVRAPGASSVAPENRQTALIGDNRPIEFVADEMGGYTIMAVLQIDARTQCSVEFEFGITDNAPYLGSSNPLTMALQQKLQNFPHLVMVGADQAWKSTQGEGVVIAIIDSGVNYNHPALKANIQINAKEIPDNNKDDDQNGLVDDYAGYDFANQDSSPFDDKRHGTHVAGLAAGAVGVAPKAKILPIKALGIFGGDGASVAGGIRYAVDSGAKIINMSMGSEVLDPVISTAISYAERNDVLVVVAAGNDGVSIERTPAYPASLKNSNLLVVAATDLQGKITNYSNYGSSSVDIAAPGGTTEQGLMSANYSNGKNQLWFATSGTSMATPIVTGVAALAFSKNPTLSMQQLKQFVINKSITKNEYQGQVSTRKLVDARNIATRP